MLLLCLSGSFIFTLPYYSDAMYVPMQRAFGFSHTQIGVLSSTFGLASLLTYAPGGWMADRFPARQLISTALLMSGTAGFVFATVPTFDVCLLLYAVYGVSASLIFWSALIKATRNWGSPDEQGKAFGLLEAGRSLSDAAFGVVFLAIFAWQGAGPTALANNVRLTSTGLVLIAALVWLVMKDAPTGRPGAHSTETAFSWTKLWLVLKMPILWLLSLVILATNWGMWGTIYFTPYATTVYELGEVWGGAVGGAKYWVAAATAVTAGLIADQTGTARAVVGLFVLMTASFVFFALIPGAPGLVPVMLINSTVAAIAVYALRGIYYALLEQGHVPLVLTGTAVGMVSVIGYTPDTFAPLVSGLILDTWTGSLGFQILFGLVGSICAIGLLAAVAIYRRVEAPASVGGRLVPEPD